MILGTAPYMSPEQAKGNPVDRRADVWAFGCVLFEMVTGRRAFDGATKSDVLATILEQEPNWRALPTKTPASIRRLLQRCLEKDPKRRLDSAAVARVDISDALAAPIVEASPTQPSRRVMPIAIVSVLGAALVATLATWGLKQPSLSVPTPVTRLTISPPTALPLTLQGTDRDFALAPDGSFLVYRAGAQAQLVVRHLGRLDASPLSGVTNARGPFVSPDSRWIGFVENNTTLKKVAVNGGLPVTLALLPGSPRGAIWVDDKTVLVATNTTGLLRVPAEGGEPIVLTTPDRARGELGHLHPSLLPGRRAVLFTIAATQPENAQIAVLDLETRQHATLMRGGSGAQYVSSGHLLYAAGRTLYAVRFDPGRRAVVGDPVPVVEGVSVSSDGAVNVAVTETGMLAYVAGSAGNATPWSLM